MDQQTEILASLKRIEERLNEALPVLPKLPDDAKDAVAARIAGRARGFYLVREFAAVIGRHSQYVSERCARRTIRTLPGGKPYRIPLSEEDVWNKLHSRY